MVSRAKEYLLDTQILIWFFEDKLQGDILEIINDPANTIYASVINAWEVIIKTRKGKLRSPSNIKVAIKRSGFDVLDTNLEHVLGLRSLPEIHKDPFDRMLIAQARVEGLTLITSDKNIWKYKVKLLKA